MGRSRYLKDCPFSVSKTSQDFTLLLLLLLLCDGNSAAALRQFACPTAVRSIFAPVTKKGSRRDGRGRSPSVRSIVGRAAHALIADCGTAIRCGAIADQESNVAVAKGRSVKGFFSCSWQAGWRSVGRLEAFDSINTSTFDPFVRRVHAKLSSAPVSSLGWIDCLGRNSRNLHSMIP